MVAIGRFNPFGVSWEIREDGKCSICGGTQIQLNYPVMIGEGIAGREYDLLCLDCGTSVNENRGDKINYDKRKLLLETMGVEMPQTSNYRHHSK